jgi:tetratricopeptide (TPR) repeat protein
MAPNQMPIKTLRRRWPLTLLLPLLLLLLPALARADLKSSDAKFITGDYKTATAEYQALAAGRSKEAARAQVHLGRALMRQGQLVGAEKAARAAMASKDPRARADGTVLLAELERETGRLREARTILEKLVRQDPRQLRARIQLGLVYRAQGEVGAAHGVFDQFYDDWSSDKIDQNDAEQLMYVAMAAHYNEGYQDAADTFRDAVDKDPRLLEANIEWGWLFLEKYNAGDAEQSFDEVLKIDPNHPDALVGLARVKLEQNYDVLAADELLDKALAVDAHHAGALAIRAELEIDNSELAAAGKTIADMLARNPGDPEAFALRGAIAFLADDEAGLGAAARAALATNPRFARFYHVIADFAVKAHRYQEAIELEQQALKIDPHFGDALAAIGTNLLRMGNETAGLAQLRKAWDRDTFNVRTYNILELFEKTIPKEYSFVTSKHFKFRMHDDEKAMLGRYVPRTLEHAFADMVKRYGFTPKLPVTIEMFADPDAYSVRTVGLPNLAALGVCFGQVITSLSPSTGNLNWAMVLWHELGHVFAIQRSKSRVPRWFTEGLSEYETIMARPEWRRENDLDVYLALAEGKLPGVLELNTQFLRARDLGQMTVAYHMSSLAVEYLGKTYGFPKIVAALDLYGAGKSDAQVIKGITGLDADAFDRQFRDYLMKRFAVYKTGFHVRLADYDDPVAYEKALAADPRNPGAMADLAAAYLVAGDEGHARQQASAALAADGKNLLALWVLGQRAAALNDVPEARKRFAELAAAGGDGYDVHLELGKLAETADAAKAEMDRAKAFDPERSEPYLVMAKLYKKANRQDELLHELEGFVQLEQMDGGALEALVSGLADKKAWDKVVIYGERATEVLPFSAPMHLDLGQAYLAKKRPGEALYEADSALLARPPLPRPALAQLLRARAARQKGDLKLARAALDQALKLEPKNAEALALKKTLR